MTKPAKKKPSGSHRIRCSVCGVFHEPRCMTQTWPTEPLYEYAQRIGYRLDGKLPNELSTTLADRKAIQLGVHPSLIWTDWFDKGLTEHDRRFVETGWRNAWLYQEQQRKEAV